MEVKVKKFINDNLKKNEIKPFLKALKFWDSYLHQDMFFQYKVLNQIHQLIKEK